MTPLPIRPVPDDAQSLVPHLDASDGLVVPTGADSGVHRTNISGSGEHQGHGQIGHRVTVGPGSDRDLDPHGMSGLQVYLIISNTVAGDDLQIFGPSPAWSGCRAPDQR